MSMTEPIFTGYTGGTISDLGDDLGARMSARDIIEETLTRYGLQSLSGFVTDMVFKENILDQNILIGRIREQPAYQERFKSNEARRRAGLNALSEGEYVALENQYRQLFRNSGLPAGFYTDKDTTDMLIQNDVSIAEVAERVNQGYEAIANADPEVIFEMRRLYGVNDGSLAAFFLDPEKATPLLLRQARTAQIAGEARQAGIEITGDIGEQLARAGVDQGQAQEGFGMIAQSGEMFGTTTQEAMAGERAFTAEEQVGAVFGTNAAAQQRLRQRARRRQAGFEAGGGFAAQGAEMTGLQ
jgi:hypothetical protein